MSNNAKFIPAIEESPGQYCDWILPRMRRYKLGCCSCGQVHDVEFRIVRAGRPKKDGYRKIEALVGSGLCVQFRARRNPKSTKARRQTLKRRRNKKG